MTVIEHSHCIRNLKEFDGDPNKEAVKLSALFANANNAS